MSIVTKTGDKGMTCLYMGGRVKKDDCRVEAYGTVDELCSFLGMAKSLIRDREVKDVIESIQKDLFVLGAELAVLPKFKNKLKTIIGSGNIAEVEKHIKKVEGKRNIKLHCFSVPGCGFVSSVFDVARAVARRAERRIVSLDCRKMVKNRSILIYMNRLSDLLYLLGRHYAKRGIAVQKS
jgi:cob(I)alamin adenosyltransferase